MRLHHLGFVGRDLGALARRFFAEGAAQVTGPIEDPVQRVRVQFFRDPDGGVLWELVAPLTTVEESPLVSRLQRGGGLDHVCYELQAGDGALEEVLLRERERGGQIVCEPVMAVVFSRRIAFVFRRSGRIVELVEPRAPGAEL